MSTLRDEITNTLLRLRGRAPKVPAPDSPSLDETVIATDARKNRLYGNYRVLKRLGIGGMGHVYLAIDTQLGRQAALKFLSPKLKSDPEMLARLKQEARTASSLNHPNILTIYDIAESAGEPFIASEFVQGVTLRQALERGAVDHGAALDIAIQIASALIPAHEAGIVHRDLKPGNIMLRPDGLVKVIDFGLAKLTAQGHLAPAYEPVSDPAWIAGTVQYMSPEQVRGDDVDHRTDLWSLGVILYEMASRQKPFDGETESQIMGAILDHHPPKMQAVSFLSSGYTKVIPKALAKDRAQRFQTAAEFLTALKSLESASAASRRIHQSIASIHLRPRAKRARIAGLAVLIIIAALSVWWWPFHGREAVLGPAWFYPASYSQVTHRGDVNLATLSPDGKLVAYTTPGGGQDQLHLLNLATNTEKTWPAHSGETVGLTFSPDNSTVYYTVHDQREWGRLYAAKENSTDPIFVLDDVDGPVTFSPDGSQLAFRRRFDDKRTNREAIVVAQVRDTGNQRIIISKYNRGVGFRVAWSADGSMAMNLPKQSLEGESRPTVLAFTPAGKELAEYTDPRLRLLSGPAWLDDGSTLIFTGIGRGSDNSSASIVELSANQGSFRFFPSPSLTENSLTLSSDFKTLAAVTSNRQSTLWAADASHLETPVQWSTDDSFTTLAWLSGETIVHPSPRGGSTALWETGPGGMARLLTTTSGCLSHQPATAPASKILVFSSNCQAAANAANLWVLPSSAARPFQLTEHSNSDRNPVLTPDGTTVLYDSWPSNYPALFKISIQTRIKSQFTPLQARSAAISPDGQHVACQIRENYDGQWRLAILAMRDGAIERDNLPLPAEPDSVVHWSPDGAALDYVNPHDSGNIWRYSIAGKQAHQLLHWTGHPISDFAWSPNGSRLAWVSNDIHQDVIIFHRNAK